MLDVNRDAVITVQISMTSMFLGNDAATAVTNGLRYAHRLFAAQYPHEGVVMSLPCYEAALRNVRHSQIFLDFGRSCVQGSGVRIPRWLAACRSPVRDGIA